MNGIRDQCWAERHKQDMVWDDVFGTGVIGSLDSFPIVLRRAKNSVFRRGTFQGKYKLFIVKVQVVVNDIGLPLVWTGPHAGVRPDIRLWREEGPVMDLDHMVFADKAYQGADDCITPFKRPRGGQLTEEQTDFNLVLG